MKKQAIFKKSLAYHKKVVRRKGFEPPTFWFVAKHSIQLSYRRIFIYQSVKHMLYSLDCLNRIPHPAGHVKDFFKNTKR